VIWEADGRGKFQKLQQVKVDQRIELITFSSDGRRLAYGSWNNTILLWEVAPQGHFQQMQQLERHTDTITSVAFSPKSQQRLVSGSSDMTIRLWDADRRGELQQVRKIEVDTTIISVTFPPDGQRLAFSLEDKTINIWGGRCSLSYYQNI
jgi:eukaryotic-like serine/threonine-protein kinase